MVQIQEALDVFRPWGFCTFSPFELSILRSFHFLPSSIFPLRFEAFGLPTKTNTISLKIYLIIDLHYRLMPSSVDSTFMQGYLPFQSLLSNRKPVLDMWLLL